MTSERDGDVHRQHLVSKVLLKRWAVDGQLLAFNLDTGMHRGRSPKAEGYEEDFIRHGSGQAEARWREFEDRAHRALCAVDRGTLFEDPSDVETIKGLIGLHVFRSRVATTMWNRALKRQVQQGESSHAFQLQALIHNPEAQDAIFEHLTGLRSAGPEARSFARAHLVERLDRRLGVGGEAFRDLMLEDLQRFMHEYAECDVEIGVASGELLIGDVPALTVDHSTRSVGLLAGVPLGSADTLFMPVGPHHVAGLGGQACYRDLPDPTTDKLNHLQLISAQRKAYMLPSSTLIESAEEETHRRQVSSGTASVGAIGSIARLRADGEG